MNGNPVFQQNPYQAPGADLHKSGKEGVTSRMAEVLGKGVFWAMALSVINFISLISIVADMLRSLSSMSAYGVGQALGSVPFLVFFWVFGISMYRYANSAKSLRDGVNEVDIADCFTHLTTYIKTMSILIGALFVIGIISLVLGFLGAF